ncbi:SnoaL-like domain protein [Pseudodesulfovibrio hydrargyri]|uniref:SnoaL-like domain protein n=1 Tax=Pseudodesulfovibrio hydrargyri TaxID=2125990 RepID=A0A1J5N0D7_9BACT|nr:nuclear transport factor 2 family protein [Pseudodesulfovibrio hydrargyri]OIQ49115.1 SnoaL-like domain protein [Pseudodesulfovibrio hydrargyri]
MMNLPPTVKAYFDAANNQDAEALLACFAPGAEVEDENNLYAGRAAIRAWKEESFAKYRPVQEPRSAERNGAVVSVVTTVSGNFPGSPVDLLHEFTLEGDAVTRLNITLA